MSCENDSSEFQAWPEGHSEMHICPSCAADMVVPLWWEELDRDIYGELIWKVALRCGECESFFEGIFEDRLLGDFDKVLDRSMAAIDGEIKRLEHEQMSDYETMFVAALRADQVWPEDFTPMSRLSRFSIIQTGGSRE